MKTTEYEPTGHLQVRLDDKSRPHAGRSYFVYWVDAGGKHGKKLGPAHVKDSGRKTPRGAIVWRAGDGPKPTPRHLTPKEAKRELDAILRDAPRRMSIEPAGTLLDALEGSLTERLRDGKVKANRRPDYEAVHGRLCRDLGGERSVANFDTEELTEYIRGLEAQKFIGPKRARQLRREGTPVEEVRIAR